MLVGFSRSAMYNCNRVDGRTVDITNGNLATIRFHKVIFDVNISSVVFNWIFLACADS